MPLFFLTLNKNQAFPPHTIEIHVQLLICLLLSFFYSYVFMGFRHPLQKEELCNVFYFYASCDIIWDCWFVNGGSCFFCTYLCCFNKKKKESLNCFVGFFSFYSLEMCGTNNLSAVWRSSISVCRKEGRKGLTLRSLRRCCYGSWALNVDTDSFLWDVAIVLVAQSCSAS